MPNRALLAATAVLSVAWQCNGKECEAFWDALGSCALPNGLISCDAGCPELALRLSADRENEVDCGNLQLCNSTLSLPNQLSELRQCSSFDCKAPAGDVFPWHRPAAPLTVLTTLKCPDAGGKTEISMPCLGGDQPIIYYSVDVHQTSGFEYEVYSEDGMPTGLMEVFNINDVENDEIMDCFAADTTDTATCHNSKISRGYQLPDSVKFDPVIKVRFGFKACSEPMANCRNKLVFRTAPKKQTSIEQITERASHGCSSALNEVPVGSIDIMCVDTEGSAALSMSASFLLLVLVSLL